MPETPIRVALVGHTNAGKTSLIRTLTRDVDFGEVADTPGTTRTTESVGIPVGDRVVLELIDTPGLEDSIALREHLDAMNARDGAERLEEFLNSDAARGVFAQESKAIQAIRDCDIALYVTDARERVLEKYRDELAILGYCARPVVPVLNFVASDRQRVDEWREQFARVNMHAIAEFDTVVLDAEGELRLFEKMRTLLDRFEPAFVALIAARREERVRLKRASSLLVAELLVDVAAYSMIVPVDSQEKAEQEASRMRSAVRAREERSVRDLLELHRFRFEDYEGDDWPIESGQWTTDLFSPDALEEYGVSSGGGAAAGAMIGLSLDAMLGGMSLGAATATGAAIGAAVGAARRPGRRLFEKLSGRVRIRVDDGTLLVLATRSIRLVEALLHRGHATVAPLRTDGERNRETSTAVQSIVRQLRPARGRPAWSSLNEAGNAMAFGERRERLIERIATLIASDL